MEQLEQVNKMVLEEKKKYGDYLLHNFKTGDKVEILRDSETGFLIVNVIPLQQLDFSTRLIFPFITVERAGRTNRVSLKTRKCLGFNTARLNSICPYFYERQKEILGEENFSKIRYITIEDCILLSKRILAHYYKEGGRFKLGRRKK